MLTKEKKTISDRSLQTFEYLLTTMCDNPCDAKVELFKDLKLLTFFFY